MITNADFKEKQIIFLLTNEGEKLSFSNDNIVVKDKNDKTKYKSTCYRIFMVCVIGNISVTSGLIQRSKKFGFTICLMTTTFRVYEVIGFRMEGNTLLRKAQYDYDGVEIGQKIQQNKIINQASALSRIRKKSEDIKEGIGYLRDTAQLLNEEKDYLSIMGLEGNAARVYFSRMFSNVAWKGRRPRIKSDYINVTLDIGYTMLFNIVDAILEVYGFDTYYGVFHKCFYMRKSLTCDIMEPMRPIVDYAVRKAISLGQCKESDFTLYDKRWMLDWKKTSIYVSFLMEAILEYKTDIFIYIQSYYRFFMKKKSVSEMPIFELH